MGNTSKIDIHYLPYAEIIKNAILSAQYEATRGANNIQLMLYYSIGRYISQNTRKGKWGTGAIASISRLLKQDLPGLYLYEVFYRNDSIGDFLDTFFNKRCYSIKLQDTIRIRTMFFIEGFLNIRGDIIPLNVDSCDNYPYFQNHNSILNNDSLYLKYF